MELVVLLFVIAWLIGCFQPDRNKLYAILPIGVICALFYWFTDDYLYVLYRAGPVFLYAFGYLLIFGVGIYGWNKSPLFLWRGGIIVVAVLFIYFFGLPFVDGYDSSDFWRFSPGRR